MTQYAMIKALNRSANCGFYQPYFVLSAQEQEQECSPDYIHHHICICTYAQHGTYIYVSTMAPNENLKCLFCLGRALIFFNLCLSFYLLIFFYLSLLLFSTELALSISLCHILWTLLYSARFFQTLLIMRRGSFLDTFLFLYLYLYTSLNSY